MKSLVEKVDRIEKRLNAINFAHEEVVDAMRQQGILADYASKLRQQRYEITLHGAAQRPRWSDIQWLFCAVPSWRR